MNIWRGLLRLWIVFSLAWVAFIVIDGLRYYWDGLYAPWLPRGHLAWAFIPPLAVLTAGGLLRWAVAGFRK